MRVNVGGTFRSEGERLWRPFKGFCPKPGCVGIAFSDSKIQLRCTLLAFWGEDHQDLWLILTDLPPESADVEDQDDLLLDIPLTAFPGAARRRGKGWRLVGIFQRGWSLIVAALLNHKLLPTKPGRPEAWPVLPQIEDTGWAVFTVGTGG